MAHVRRLEGDAAVFGLALALSLAAHGGVLAGFLLLPSELPPRSLAVVTVELIASVEPKDLAGDVADEAAATPPPPTSAAAAPDVREQPPVAPAPRRRPLPYAQAPHPSPPVRPTVQIAGAPKPAAAIAPSGAGARQAVAVVAPRYAGGGIANPPPRYPYMARRRGKEGQVLLRVRVTADGNAATVRVRRSSGYPLLDAAAATAVRSWRFHPASRGGRPVAGAVDVPVAFTLTD